MTIDQTRTTLPPLAAPKPHRRSDDRRLSEGDLDRLWKSDPFPYLRPPATVRRARRHPWDDDRAAAAQEASEASGASRSDGSIVSRKRKSRASTESPADVVVEDLLNDEELLVREFEVLEELRVLLSAARRRTSS